MPDEELNEQEQTEVASEEAYEESQQEAPAFDADAEREKIRAEESARIQSEMEAKYRPQEVAKKDEPKEEDLSELMYSDPARALQIHGERVAKQVMDQVSPLLGVVRENTVEQKFRAAGVQDAGMAMLKGIPNLDPTQLQGPAFDILVNAAKFEDMKKPTPTRMSPERPYGERGGLDITDAERKEYGIGTQYGPTEAEVRAWKKEEAELNRR